ncbi:MAG: MarR family winged helix-turn-helix transcriptional regulator [Sandaracinaceae bacterium]
MPANATRLHALLERLSAVFRASLRETATRHGLKLVQLEALVYLATANRYSDTPAALTEYLGVTKGTVSQTLTALARRGLLTKAPDREDARVRHCHLTAEGRRIARAAYPADVLVGLGANEGAEDALEALLRRLQRANGLRTFGVCHTCRFFQPRGAGGRCGLTGEALSRLEVTKICREHQDPTPEPT